MKDSPSSRPDLETLAWWRLSQKAIQFQVNQACAEYVSADERILELADRVTTLEADLELARAAVGELREELEDSLEKVRTAYKELKNGG